MNFRFLICFLFLFISPLIPEAKLPSWDCSLSLMCFQEIELEDGWEIWVINKLKDPRVVNSVFVQGHFVNIESDQKLPLQKSIRGNQPTLLLRLKIQDPSLGFDRRLNFLDVHGDWSAVHDDSVSYILPFAPGIRSRITQGYQGKKSHREFSANALDFDLPEGTPIHAARAGLVVETQDMYTEGAFRKNLISKANYIIIQHEDGTIANYAHLKPKGVVVSKGDWVVEGQMIGFSGNTGYTEGPHLHFDVKIPKNRGEMQTIPTMFITPYGKRDRLKEQYLYWVPKPGELPPTEDIFSDDIVICSDKTSNPFVDCPKPKISWSESLCIGLGFLRPGPYQISLAFQKDKEPPQTPFGPILSHPELGVSFFTFHLGKDPNWVGRFRIIVSVNGVEKKTKWIEISK